MNKICSKCKKEKPIENFCIRKGSIDGINYTCRNCQSLQNKTNIKILKAKLERFPRILPSSDTIIVCTKCKETKKVNEFYKHKYGKYGLRTTCKICDKREAIAYARRIAEKNCQNPPVILLKGIYKTCSVCRKNKPIVEFSADKYKKGGRENRCQDCRRTYKRNRYKILSQRGPPADTKTNKTCSICHKEKPIEEFYKTRFVKNRTSQCKECLKVYRMNKYRRNSKYRDKLIECSQQYRGCHKEEIKKYNFIYKSTHKKEICLRQRNRRKTDLCFKIVSNLRAEIHRAIKDQNIKKSKRTMESIGCDIGFLKTYIAEKFTKGMTWKNYGRFGWHIDHIKPCASFDLTKPEEQRKCFHYKNLQPMWWADNLSKNSWYKGLRYSKGRVLAKIT